MNNDLKWIVESGKEEIDFYLENVSTDQFVIDVKELIKNQSDKSAIQEAVNKLQELL